MKAYTKINNNDQKELEKFLETDAQRVFAELIVHSKSFDELCFDLDMEYKADKEFKIGDAIAKADNDASICYEESTKNLYSQEPFLYIDDMLKIFDSQIFEYLDEDYVHSILKRKNLKDEELYKHIIYYVCSTYLNLAGDVINIIQSYMTSYGFIRNVKKNDVLVNQCNVFELIYIFYIIYETFYLFEKLNDVTKVTQLSLFKLKYEINSEKDIINKITRNLNYLENIDSFTYHSEYNKNKMIWETSLLFNNSLSLVMYELRMQLSKNSDVSFSICKNPLCMKPFLSTNRNQQYCSDEDCLKTRQNQRQRKCREKKTIKST